MCTKNNRNSFHAFFFSSSRHDSVGRSAHYLIKSHFFKKKEKEKCALYIWSGTNHYFIQLGIRKNMPLSPTIFTFLLYSFCVPYIMRRKIYIILCANDN